MSSSRFICTICRGGLRDTSEDVQFISVCGHVFHEHCLQQCIRSGAGRDPSCPFCKCPIPCPARDIIRLNFLFAGSNSERDLQRAVEDPEHVSRSSSWESPTGMHLPYYANLRRAKKLLATTVAARSELAQSVQDLMSVRVGRERSELAQSLRDLMSIQEEMLRRSLEHKKLLEEIRVMASRVQALWDSISREN